MHQQKQLHEAPDNLGQIVSTTDNPDLGHVQSLTIPMTRLLAPADHPAAANRMLSFGLLLYPRCGRRTLHKLIKVSSMLASFQLSETTETLVVACTQQMARRTRMSSTDCLAALYRHHSLNTLSGEDSCRSLLPRIGIVGHDSSMVPQHPSRRPESHALASSPQVDI